MTLRTALVHYWLVADRGGEVVLRRLLEHHPDADLFTHVYRPEKLKSIIGDRPPPQTTSIARLPFAKKMYPLYVGLMPAALERLDMSAYDLIVSCEAGPAKWVIPPPHARHVCYIHSPMRYLWDQRFLYRNKVPAPARPLFDWVTGRLRAQDLQSAARVDQFVANSAFVAQRVHKYYRREATVIHPPVPMGDIPAPQAADDFYLLAGQLVSYKATRVAVDACRALGRRLVVVGDGPDRKYVEALVGPKLEYRGRVPREELVSLMGRCRALLFPGIEDFGITPVETQAAGRPVIAYGRGGAVETVAHARTGWLYHDPSVEGLMRAIEDFEQWEPTFRPEDALQSAQRFTPEAFDAKWRDFIAAS
jgi:glycosyltransferase involved in cell wall biosynthesis